MKPGDRVTWIPPTGRKRRGGTVVRILGERVLVERRETTRNGNSLVRTVNLPVGTLTVVHPVTLAPKGPDMPTEDDRLAARRPTRDEEPPHVCDRDCPPAPRRQYDPLRGIDPTQARRR